MMNGEGDSEALPEAVSLNDRLDDELLTWKVSDRQLLDRSNEVSPVSSRYSSCGESEFDRYCSANSVMGTPSLCGSVGTFQDFPDSDIGCVKSLRVGDVGVLESFSLGGRLERKSDDKNSLALGRLGEYRPRSESSDVKRGLNKRNNEKSEQTLVVRENEMHSYDELETSFTDLPDGGGVVLWKDDINSKRMQSTSTHRSLVNNISAETMEKQRVEEGSEPRMGIDQVNNIFEGEKHLDAHSEGETSARLEHSESEGSMFGYGTDDEEPTDLPPIGSMWKDNINSKSIQDTSNKPVVNNISAEAMEEHMIEGSASCKGIHHVNNVFEGGRHLDERSDGETSSMLEHSESEGSMYGYGTDIEEPTGLSSRGYPHYSQDKKSNSENTLLMTSAIAYGSNDWNDFMQETMENPQNLFVIDENQGHNQNEIGSGGHVSKSTFGCQSIDVSQKQENVKDFHMNNQIDVSHDLPMYSKTHSISHIDLLKHGEEDRGQFVNDMAVIAKQAEDVNQLKLEEVSRVEKAPLMDVLPRKPEHTNSKKTTDSLTSHLKLGHVSSTLTQEAEDHVAEMPKDKRPFSLQSLPNINVEKKPNATPISFNIPEDLQKASKAENYELNEFYDEVVYEMEEILLDSGESPAARFTRSRKHHSQLSLPSRDGGSTASTSSIDNSHSVVHKIDGIQVVGAKQKKGDVSLGERLVGVKEYTVYTLRVWSGTHQWEVERRYRDFFTLYRRLKASFANKGWDLPSPWSSVDRESRKYFGNASPDVISERSVLIQECLQSIIHSKFSSSLPSSMMWFLSPPKTGPGSPVFNTHISQSQISSGSKPTPVYTLGQSISLIVEIRPHKSMRQMLEAQHYTCAGCHKYFDEGKTRLWEFVQTLGWGKPRVCEYSGQVFCSSCHINETAILPARVLHWWDFTEYPVSQLAKSYLDSIHDKPMLCVSAVNPFLFSKVPPLQHVINVRKRIGRMLPYVRCPFRRSIYKGVGSRRYILESSDFFALKDLVDLSKGVFAALPVMVETISKKIVDHITDECLICYDVGVPCGARQACDDPSSLIFPFQEGEIERCKPCELVYHKACYKKTVTCPCGVDLGERSVRTPNVSTNEVPKNLVNDTESRSSMAFLSGLLSKATPAKFWRPKDNDTVIPMGSLPNSSL
ncbi:uncharacterized protein LOC112514564 isoform X1 [Cynara cardunculus var. scolymus]|uniref:uncharacterized protein LOC112514564 isoform X1 n=1 Tax=Cynara cardunculus var. scolymus TaxID=59895 RepID=UPI000D629C8E|nr:uncharacterized protein LOC112514564 isoform X1 [Cynara cardunculus var. scolymus]